MSGNNFYSFVPNSDRGLKMQKARLGCMESSVNQYINVTPQRHEKTQF